MTENYTYAPVERVVLTTAEFAALRDTAARLETALLECVAQEATLRGERDELAAKMAAVPVEAIRLAHFGDAFEPGYMDACSVVGDWLIELAYAGAAREVGA